MTAGENQESRIKNHGRAAAWLVWIGAFFVLSLVPLQHVFYRLLASGAWSAPSANEYDWALMTYHASYFLAPGPGWLLHGAVAAILVAPFVIATRWPARPWVERAIIAAFFPLSVLLCLAAEAVSPAYLYLSKSAYGNPRWTAALPVAAGMALVSAGFLAGAGRTRLALLARRGLAASILWVVILQWCVFAFSYRYFPGWIGVVGALTLLLNEMRSRTPLILDSRSA